MNPLSDRYLAVESLIFSRSTIEFYRNRGTLPHELPSRFYGSSSPFCASLSPLVGSRSSGTTMRTAALTVTLYVLRQLIIFSPHNYHPCRFISLFAPHTSFSSSLPLSFSLKTFILENNKSLDGLPQLSFILSLWKIEKKKKKGEKNEWWGSIESKFAKICLTTILFWRKTM